MWFTLGIREVLKGWDVGLQDMCSGEKRKLVIPPDLAYGKEGKGIEALFVFCLQCMLLNTVSLCDIHVSLSYFQWFSRTFMLS